MTFLVLSRSNSLLCAAPGRSHREAAEPARTNPTGKKPLKLSFLSISLCCLGVQAPRAGRRRVRLFAAYQEALVGVADQPKVRMPSSMDNLSTWGWKRNSSKHCLGTVSLPRRFRTAGLNELGEGRAKCWAGGVQPWDTQVSKAAGPWAAEG